MPVVAVEEQEVVEQVEQVVPVLVVMVEFLEMEALALVEVDLEEVVVDIKHHQLFQVVVDQADLA